MAMATGGAIVLASIFAPIMLMGEALGSREYFKTGNGFEVSEESPIGRNVEIV